MPLLTCHFFLLNIIGWHIVIVTTRGRTEKLTNLRRHIDEPANREIDVNAASLDIYHAKSYL